MTLVAIWWHRISQGSDGKFSNWSNFQKMLASFYKNSIIISAEIYTRFFYVLKDIKRAKPFKVVGVRQRPLKYPCVFQPALRGFVH